MNKCVLLVTSCIFPQTHSPIKATSYISFKQKKQLIAYISLKWLKSQRILALNSQKTRGSKAAPGQVLIHTLFQAMSNIFQFGIFCTSRTSFNLIVISRQSHFLQFNCNHALSTIPIILLLLSLSARYLLHILQQFCLM